MARFEFGGTLASWLVQRVEAPEGAGFADGTYVVVLPTQSVTLDIRDAPDGSEVTDLQDADGNPINEIIIQAGDPYIPRFFGPDGSSQLWTQEESGTWLPLPRYDLESGESGGDVMLAGGNAQEFQESPSEPWLQLSYRDDGTDSSQWPNRFEIRYYDETTSRYRVGLHANEKGLLRVRGVTPNDVPVRLMAHPDLSSQWPVMEVTGDNSQDPDQKHFQVFESKTVSHNPVEAPTVKVPYFENPAGERLYFGSADPSTDPAYEGMRPDIGDAWIDFTEEGEGS